MLFFRMHITILAFSTCQSPPYYTIYVPNFATKCCHNFALYEIQPIDVFALPFNKAEFINTVGSKETQNIEEQYHVDSNGCQEQGNAFTAIFHTLGSARIKTQRRS
jgi:hypothetical protein